MELPHLLPYYSICIRCVHAEDPGQTNFFSCINMSSKIPKEFFIGAMSQSRTNPRQNGKFYMASQVLVNQAEVLQLLEDST